ncbi:MAG: hypothetical protein LAP85_18985 [Acidobacteriia bacterium]|nr:hypothetical protein [Terriglobia bacterium]
MSLNISDAVNAPSQHGLARPSASAGQSMKRPTGQLPEGADAVPKVRSPAELPDNPLMRTQPAASTDDSLQRLPETSESGRQRSRVRKGSAAPDKPPDVQSAVPQQKMRCPYDPPPARQRDLDLLA